MALAKVHCAPVEEALQHAAGDGTLRSVRELKLGAMTLRTADLALWSTDQGGLVTRCLHGATVGMHVQVSLLQVRERKPWGIIWARTHREGILPVSKTVQITLPAWWRFFDAETVVSLY